jgi:methylthioribose-1-phosphate isomerase
MANARSPDARAPAAPYEPIRWRDGVLSLLDQTRLPWALEYVRIEDSAAACEAIRTMRVRGAPAVGIAAAYALALDASHSAHLPLEVARARIQAAAGALAATRPTAVNLRWAIDRVRVAVEAASDASSIAAGALNAARAIHGAQAAADAAMARAGAALLEAGPAAAATVITHCNTGPLATGGGGTALGVIIEAHRRGLVGSVLVDETRPRLQGARLTSWELQQHGVPHHVIADGAAASLLAARNVTAAFVGADRIAANGDTANKIGTFALALACQYHRVPFYVVAPLSTVDLATLDGAAIVIEGRDAEEVLAADGTRLAAPGARALNPAFDVTPAELITAIVTEAGVMRPPFGPALAGAVGATAR